MNVDEIELGLQQMKEETEFYKQISDGFNESDFSDRRKVSCGMCGKELIDPYRRGTECWVAFRFHKIFCNQDCCLEFISKNPIPVESA